MEQRNIFVAGATGATGGEVVMQLLRRGHRVRALAHRHDERAEGLARSGAEVVFGDLLDFDAMRTQLAGIQAAYFVYPIRPGILSATVQFAQAAREAGLDMIVNMSQISAREDSKSHAARDHWLSERVFDWSGIPTAHVRPTFFAEWLLYLAPMIRAGILHVPFGTGRHAPIAAEDQAAVIAAILEQPAAHAGKIYPLFGPVELTHAEIARAIAHELGRPVTYQQVPFETFLQILGGSGQKPPIQHTATALYGEFEDRPDRNSGDSFLIQHLREVAVDHQNGLFAGTNNVVETIGGRPPMTIEAFIRKHAATFVASSAA
ncbi:NmrA family NAD(P)-binding protein [Xanthobacter aminoxidans]|uniref:NmrA family NAD(P)-binding protein n=1 Tax=Xanthobacter aminoxidans TaxID=186280 RepID=UPI003727DC57